MEKVGGESDGEEGRGRARLISSAHESFGTGGVGQQGHSIEQSPPYKIFITSMVVDDHNS